MTDEKEFDRELRRIAVRQKIIIPDNEERKRDWLEAMSETQHPAWLRRVLAFFRR